MKFHCEENIIMIWSFQDQKQCFKFWIQFKFDFCCQCDQSSSVLQLELLTLFFTNCSKVLRNLKGKKGKMSIEFPLQITFCCVFRRDLPWINCFRSGNLPYMNRFTGANARDHVQKQRCMNLFVTTLWYQLFLRLHYEKN